MQQNQTVEEAKYNHITKLFLIIEAKKNSKVYAFMCETTPKYNH
jgi:hypothetical protein